ncbi:hypothetical protein BCO9919_07256 [Burkholderia cenocepacia]|uniref:Uncharacterized protein n=1 Tax=Burkholderia cenocepacia TaxID=95486 RepID=A0A6J5JXX8_9BURK|nr:hypothetical protein BCO9919_07256 [Burkholderia cenocepacia]
MNHNSTAIIAKLAVATIAGLTFDRKHRALEEGMDTSHSRPRKQLCRIDIESHGDSLDIVNRYVDPCPFDLTDKRPIQTGGKAKLFLRQRPCNPLRTNVVRQHIPQRDEFGFGIGTFERRGHAPIFAI